MFFNLKERWKCKKQSIEFLCRSLLQKTVACQLPKKARIDENGSSQVHQQLQLEFHQYDRTDNQNSKEVMQDPIYVHDGSSSAPPRRREADLSG
jgi:hypothetical protein